MACITHHYLEQLDKLTLGTKGNLIYRGQSDHEWLLKSTAIRRLRTSNLAINKRNYETYNQRLIRDAKRYGYQKEKSLTDTHLLCELQHYGAATGLLDFSKNLLVALWKTFCIKHSARIHQTFR